MYVYSRIPEPMLILQCIRHFIEPGDTVMGLNLAHGGHLTHGSPVNLSGILYHFVPYNVNDDGYLDYDEIRKIAQECKPKDDRCRRICISERDPV